MFYAEHKTARSAFSLIHDASLDYKVNFQLQVFFSSIVLKDVSCVFANKKFWLSLLDVSNDEKIDLE